MNANNCPCCSESMLLHLSRRRSYWFCNHCRLEMPTSAKASRNKTVDLTPSLEAAIA